MELKRIRNKKQKKIIYKLYSHIFFKHLNLDCLILISGR